MNVTRKNYRNILPEVEETIEKCSFIALDCEFTGLSTENNISPYDRPEEAFKKYSENSSGYILIQLGLTAVRPSEEDEKKFLYKSYNFYIFPHYWKTSFKCQGTSLSFLAENGFDFSKLFCEGISYCNEEEEKMLKERFLERQKQREEWKNSPKLENSNYTPVPDEEKEAIERISRVIQEFLDSDESERVIGNCNGFQRKLIYEMIEKKYHDKISATTKTIDANQKIILIERKKTPEEEEQIEEDRKRAELLELEDNIGISTLIHKISESKKLIIGHNMLLDLLFILRQFFHSIPNDFKEFKKFAHSKFPYIIDTKFMSSQQNFKNHIKSNVLPNLVQTISEEPFTVPVLSSETNEYEYSLKTNKAHEAGYDSYLTAVVFLAMTNYLNISPKKLLGDSTELKQYINKIFLMKIQDVCHINLDGNEPSPSRDHVFHITVPETWKQSDVVNHFKKYGTIYITWINSTSALISLHNRENASILLKSIKQVVGVIVQSFIDYKTSLEKKLAITQDDEVNHTRKRKSSIKSASSDDCVPCVAEKRQKSCKSSQKETSKSSSKKIHFDECNDWS